MNPQTSHWGHRVRRALLLEKLPSPVRKVVVALLGVTVVLVGVLMIVMPGPAFLVIPVGILLLGTEFMWAEKLGAEFLAGLSRIRENWRSRRQRRAQGI
ncbi:MAG TPA: PGPGW domain-containing protein [Verrucomicrobiales bacterium]|nr:PGPGW domain-containing protein [Verrucomicrobiales bacterium]